MTKSDINAMLSERAKETLRRLLESAYLAGAESSISGRDAWRKVSDATETVSRILAGVTSILCFAASVYADPVLSFVAGSIGTAGITLAGFSTYASRESKERLSRLNAILVDVDMTPVTDAPASPSQGQEENAPVSVVKSNIEFFGNSD